MFTNVDFWYTVLRCTTTVLFATDAALIASRCGIINIGLEGTMSVAALFGVLGSGYTGGNLMVGLLCGLVAGTAYTMLLAWFVQHFKANPIITGIALNLAASGGTVFLMYTLTGDKNITNSLTSASFPTIDLPGIQSIPVLGQMISGHNLLTYISLIATLSLYFVLKKTTFGIHVRSVGDAENAARSVGLPVEKIRYMAFFISGILASLGGMYLSMGYVNRFTAGMTAGRGYIALATQAMAAGNALLAMVSSWLYGFGSAVAIYLQNANVDPYLITIIPYAFIIVFYLLFSVYYRYKAKKLASGKYRSADSKN